MSLPNAHDMARVLGGRATGPNQLSAPGPNNKDRKRDASMSVTIGNQFPGGWTVFSHSPKNTWQDCRDYIVRQMGWDEWKPDPSYKRSTFIEKRRPKPKLVPKPKPVHDGPVVEVCEYIYRDRDGEPYRSVVRMSDKSFLQFRHEPEGRFPGVKGLKVIPYRLPEIIENPHAPIWLVEGEKDADRLASYGLVATTAPMGAQNFPSTDEFAGWFDGTVVYAIPDNDLAGQDWTEKVLARIPHAQVIHLPHLEESEDVSDWLDAGYTIEQLFELATGGAEPEPIQESASPLIYATPFEWSDPSAIPPRDWLYGSHLIRKFVSLTVSPGGLGKSSLVLVEALAMTSGRALLKDDEPRTPEPLRVWYWNGEDPQEETQRRVVAAASHYGLKPEDFASRLWTDTGREQELILGYLDRGGITLNDDLFTAIEETILANKIDVISFDPFVSTHRLGENDNNAIDAIVKRLGKLADRCNCAAEIVHHVRKPSGGNTAETDVNDARGASALIGGVRSARVLNVMSEDIATAAGISADQRQSYFSVANGKSNMAPRSGDAKWRRLESFCLNNQTDTHKADNIGVVTQYVLPETAQGPDLSKAEEIALTILGRDETIRHHSGRGPAPKNWLGYRMADLMGLNDTDMKQVRRLIQGWIKDGVMHVREGYEDRNSVLYLAAGKRGGEIQPETDDNDPF